MTACPINQSDLPISVAADRVLELAPIGSGKPLSRLETATCFTFCFQAEHCNVDPSSSCFTFSCLLFCFVFSPRQLYIYRAFAYDLACNRQLGSLITWRCGLGVSGKPTRGRSVTRLLFFLCVDGHERYRFWSALFCRQCCYLGRGNYGGFNTRSKLHSRRAVHFRTCSWSPPGSQCHFVSYTPTTCEDQ